MRRTNRKEAAAKADRALELHEQGIRRTDIAERLGVCTTHLGGMLQRARQRREKQGDIQN